MVLDDLNLEIEEVHVIGRKRISYLEYMISITPIYQPAYKSASIR